MKAVAVVRVDPAVVKEAFAEASKGQREALGGAGLDVRVGDDDKPYTLRYFEDATAVHLGIGMEDVTPEAVVAVLEGALGGLLGMHDDPRGVPVYPDTYTLEGRAWADVAEELGDAAEWVPVETTEVVEDPMAGLLGALGPGAGDLGQLAAQLRGQDPGALMQQAIQMAQQLAASGALQDMQRAMQQMMGASPPQERRVPDGPQAQGFPPGMPGMGLDLEAMARQAQEMLDSDPDLQRRLQAQLGQMMGAVGPAHESGDEGSGEVIDADLEEAGEGEPEK